MRCFFLTRFTCFSSFQGIRCKYTNGGICRVGRNLVAVLNRKVALSQALKSVQYKEEKEENVDLERRIPVRYFKKNGNPFHRRFII